VLGLLLFSAAGLAAEEDPRVAYIEEIEVMPDGSQRAFRYEPGQRPVPQTIPAPAQPVRRRELNSVEKQELDQLERDFAHGKISESEYVQRKRALLRGTYMGGALEDDGLFTQSHSF
jgi:hypothetical protein